MRSVLVVEDDEDSRGLVSELLREEGYEVHCTADARVALQQLREMRPGLVLLDLRMPGMTGDQFCAEQRQDPALASIPVVLLSGDVKVGAMAEALGVASFLQKPICLDDLFLIVRQYCEIVF